MDGGTFPIAGGCLQVCKCVQTNKIKAFVHHKCVHKRVQEWEILSREGAHRIFLKHRLIEQEVSEGTEKKAEG